MTSLTSVPGRSLEESGRESEGEAPRPETNKRMSEAETIGERMIF